MPAKVVRDSAKRELSGHLRDFLGDLRIKGRNAVTLNQLSFTSQNWLTSVAGSILRI